MPSPGDPALPPPPTARAIAQARSVLAPYLVATPTVSWSVDEGLPELEAATQVYVKLELLQHAGSFKTRAALLTIAGLDPEQRQRGVTAVSAGNHAIAVAWSARRFATSAKVVMFEGADPHRIARCRELGAEVVIAADVHDAFAVVERIERDEGRAFVHPFEGPTVALGTATLGAEIADAVADLDAVIVPIGGGGLCAGVATAIKTLQPRCAVYGVEPVGADSMRQSLVAGRAVAIDRVATVADSLGAPRAEPYTFSLCQRFVDDVVGVDDEAILRALARVFRGLKLAVEPAAAAATAALLGPLRERLQGRRVAVIACGTNIGAQRFAAFLAAGEGA